ncbi:MAG: hypothetical protein AVDCRST_MAG76-1949, partial [uncultured Acidimicrobiales bacterium]
DGNDHHGSPALALRPHAGRVRRHRGRRLRAGRPAVPRGPARPRPRRAALVTGRAPSPGGRRSSMGDHLRRDGYRCSHDPRSRPAGRPAAGGRRPRLGRRGADPLRSERSPSAPSGRRCGRRCGGRGTGRRIQPRGHRRWPAGRGGRGRDRPHPAPLGARALGSASGHRTGRGGGGRGPGGRVV